MRIDTNFPGGNGRVHDFDGTSFMLSPDLRDTTTSWFYWAFRLSDLESFRGRTITFKFISDNPVGVRGAAVAVNGRKNWHWSENEPFGNDFFTYTIPEDAEELYLTFAPLYTQIEWDEFISQINGESVDAGFITKSRGGRDVELLHLGKAADTAFHHVLFTARHHCCEMIANYVMEGIISTILHDGSMEALYLKDNVSFSFFPFVDKDGVENGDQGKNRYPHDHARDYGGELPFIYPETAAVAKIINTVIKHYKHIDLVIDLHCPWIRSGLNEAVHFVGKNSPKDAPFRKDFGTLIEAYNPKNAMPYMCSNDLPFGEGWNTNGNYTQGMSLGMFANHTEGVDNTTSLEIPYANAQGVVVTPDSARSLGKGIALAMARFLMNK